MHCPRVLPTFGVLSLVPVFTLLPSSLKGQSLRCGAAELRVSLTAESPVYSDAMDLSQSLTRKGIVVQCVLLSKMEGLFKDEAGASLFRTDHGDFEVLFLPKSRSFVSLKVNERKEEGGYVYTFQGPPQPWPANHFESASRTYFLKRDNRLFVLNSEDLAKTLQRIFQTS